MHIDTSVPVLSLRRTSTRPSSSGMKEERTSVPGMWGSRAYMHIYIMYICIYIYVYICIR